MKKGFTLIELLAVIIVLAIIALIATPSIINVINSAKDKSDLESVHGILDSARLFYSESMLNSDLRGDIENLNNIYEKVSLSVKEKAGELYINEKGLSAIAIVIRNKCYTKQFTGDIKITENIDNCTLGYVGIDTTAPTVTFNVEEGVFNSNGWAKSNFNVNITINDNESGPNSYKYCIDTYICEPEVLVNNTTGFSEISNNSETNKVCVIGIDNYGNESDIICSNNYKLDSVIPNLTAKSESITITEGDSNLVSSYFNIPSYGISGGNLICNPDDTSGLAIGNKTVSCTATSNSDISVTINKTITVNARVDANAPQLLGGMTPIKWVNGVETTTTTSDPNWYDYNNKLWANAKTADGSYWVWIPRYAYKITNSWHSDVTGIIDVVFLKNDTNQNSKGLSIQTGGYSTTGTNTSNAYFVHPAFQNSTGNTKYGFWITKFKLSNTTSFPKSLPDSSSLKFQLLNDMYNSLQNMPTKTNYGWNSGTTDIHMLTNHEWGAIAYLTESKYGKNSEVLINDSSSKYNTTYGMSTSTTGNITGIYEMSGSSECVAAYVKVSNGNLGYGSKIVSSTINKNEYAYSSSQDIINYELNKNMYGDAVYETSSADASPWKNSWYGGDSFMPGKNILPWFVRGTTGIFSFNVSQYNGGNYTDCTIHAIGVLE